VLGNLLKERLDLRPRNKDRPQAPMNQKRLCWRVVIDRDHLVERYSPAAAVIGPEADNRWKMTLLKFALESRGILEKRVYDLGS